MKPAGILPLQLLREAVEAGALSARRPIEEDQIQPASLDLRLGSRAWRVRASFLPRPGGEVAEGIARYAMHEINLAQGAVLERGCVYIVELMEQVALDSQTVAIANPKSSTGRLDVFARLIADKVPEFDRLPADYTGKLYVELAPRTFSILVRESARLIQLRLRRIVPSDRNISSLLEPQYYSKRGEPFTADDSTLQQLHARDPLVEAEAIFANGLVLTVDTQGTGGIVAWKARAHTDLIDVDKINHYDPDEFWEPVVARTSRGIILNPDDFYILASKERVSIPIDHAAELQPYDTNTGEFRVHYAGFFDPGFGHKSVGGRGSRAVLEVRAHDVPFVVENGQPVGRLTYEPMLATPDKIYGGGIGSAYQAQGLRLGKQFREPRGTGSGLEKTGRRRDYRAEPEASGRGRR